MANKQRRALIKQLRALGRDCANDDWDGRGALALKPESLRRAEVIAINLPDGFPMPECAPEPDGSISLDWIFSRPVLYSLSVGGSERLAYAWMDGKKSGHGVACLTGPSMPALFLSKILALAKGDKAIRGR